ncbi:MAG TPA: DUF3568 family protein [Candidatus Wujingus californicus]|uniref:DUF3568 family protein n=2 Tax=Candidatus Wujingus californicus TaxID=3367618 RepID=UPI001D706043|nr:DUF3568 family protein [Planctomycetota bacterium]MDO8131338.1 DUF3568 family protein [Candidatus Brocadiales bacterium]
MMIQKIFLYVLLLGIPLLVGSGCAALLIGGGAGAGTVAYLKGELKSTEEASIDKTWQAAQETMKDLEFVITSKEKDTFSAKLIAYRANDKKVEMYLQKASERTTEVKIRVGVFGDESLSRIILESLKKHL